MRVEEKRRMAEEGVKYLRTFLEGKEELAVDLPATRITLTKFIMGMFMITKRIASDIAEISVERYKLENSGELKKMNKTDSELATGY